MNSTAVPAQFAVKQQARRVRAGMAGTTYPPGRDNIGQSVLTPEDIRMKITAIVLMFLAIACEVFSYWGLNTIAGRQAFDEMAGIIPLAAGLLGALLAVSAVVVWWFGRRARTRRHAG